MLSLMFNTEPLTGRRAVQRSIEGGVFVRCCAVTLRNQYLACRVGKEGYSVNYPSIHNGWAIASPMCLSQAIQLEEFRARKCI